MQLAIQECGDRRRIAYAFSTIMHGFDSMSVEATSRDRH
jgi:S-adenosylmethionine/arginine decarboxylase-like enzyme